MSNASFNAFGKDARDAAKGMHAQSNGQATFVDAILDIRLQQQRRRNPLEWAMSLIAHFLIIAALLLAPFMFTQVIDLRGLQTTFLVAPPPPAPPPPAPQPQKLVRALPRMLPPNQFMAPAVIPARIQVVREDAPPDVGGVIGGVQSGGVLGGIIGGVTDMKAVVAPPITRQILRVGGEVKQPQPISTPQPAYPAVARSAKIEGVVIIDAVIDEEGDIVRARAIGGPSLLVGAALAAVSQWKYQPTYLDGQAVEIETHVEVHFHLH
jgi:periplasmic protein TonB